MTSTKDTIPISSKYKKASIKLALKETEQLGSFFELDGINFI